MKNKRRYIGHCALCGKESTLTFEHIPPRKAFNWTPTKTVSGDTLINSVANERNHGILMAFSTAIVSRDKVFILYVQNATV